MRQRGHREFITLLVWLAAVATACGGGTGGAAGGGGDGESRDLIVGTTDTVVSLDPARVYDYYSSNILFNAGNTLVGFQPGSTEVSPQLASEMPDVSEDGLTYTFALRDGVTFHDGSEMTSEDVKFSLERAVNINHPEGAPFLLQGIANIDAPDPQTVVITLEEPNITFLSRLAYIVGTILPSDGEYPAPDGPRPEGEDPEQYLLNQELVGTGPYRVTDFRENESITLEAFEDFWGEPPANDRVLVRFFATSSQLKAALEAGEVDVAYRHLTPQQRQDLEGAAGIQIIEGDGASIRYLVMNPNLPPVDDVAVRKAVAAAVDRQRIIDDVLGGAGEPLFSMIPTGFEAYQPAFEQVYAEAQPSQFTDEKIALDLWYSTDHYGDTEPSIAQTLERSLEETGAFDVTLQSTEWAQFTEQAWPGASGRYPAYLLGWYPDYFDPDDYIEPFYSSEQSFLGVYSNPRMDELIAAEQTAEDPQSEQRMQTFTAIQQLAAEDTPIVPLFEEIPFAFAREGVEGVDRTMDPVQIFRYYVISKSQ